MASARTNQAPPSSLDSEELTLWRNFLLWSEGVTGAVAQALTTGANLSKPDYEVLKRLLEAGGAQPRQALEQSLGWSPSRLSHQLRRMEARGLVGRAGAGQGRNVNVAIAAAGQEAMAVADQVHAEAVRRHLLDGLPGEVRAFLLASPADQ